MATFPLYQPEYGFRLPRTHVADVDLPYYSFVKLGDINGNNKDTKVTLAGAGDIPIGVVIPETGDDFMVVSDTSGYGDGVMPRTGYKAGKDYPQIHVFGPVHIKLAAQVTAGQKSVVGSGGFGDVYVTPTVSSTPTGSQIQTLDASKDTVAGTYIDSGAVGAYAKIFMKLR
jgi:hypothetical protein